MDRNLDQRSRPCSRCRADDANWKTSFLRNLMGDIDAGLQAAIQSPARLFRTMMSGGGASEDLAAVLEIVARPSERPRDVLRAGYWMLRVVPGTGDVGHLTVLVSGDLQTSAALAADGIPAGERAGRPVWPGHRGRRLSPQPLAAVRPPLARSRGRVPPHSMILRPRFSQDDPYLDDPAASPDQPAPYGGVGLEDCKSRRSHLRRREGCATSLPFRFAGWRGCRSARTVSRSCMVAESSFPTCTFSPQRTSCGKPRCRRASIQWK